MQVKDLMTRDMVIANTSDTVLDVAKLMRHHNIGCVPVVADGTKVLGLVTDRDIALNISKYNLDVSKALASSIMSENVYSVKPDANVEDALALMKKQKIRRLPVIDDDELMGMISIGDIATTKDFKMEISDALAEISSPSRVKNI